MLMNEMRRNNEKLKTNVGIIKNPSYYLLTKTYKRS
jgi:hypothetical protein